MRRLLLTTLLLSVLWPAGALRPQTASAAGQTGSATNYRVYYVNSYHQGYPWSDAIEKTIRETLEAFARESGQALSLGLFRLDSKRHPQPEEISAAARAAYAEIRETRPDVVIVSDDNAVRYLVEPYLGEEKIPVVFCGVNWSSDRYRLTAGQVTGMIEVPLVDQIVKLLQGFVRGPRIAFLKGDDSSARIDAKNIEQAFGLTLDIRLVKDFAAWKREYQRLQQETDLLILGNSASIAGWDEERALAWVRDNTAIPSGGWDHWMAGYCLVTFANFPDEQGKWAAQTALRILQGTAIAEIAPVYNRKAEILLNMPLAKRLGILFPINLIENATLIRE